MGSCCKDETGANQGEGGAKQGCCAQAKPGLKHADLVESCALTPTQMALSGAGACLAWYAMPDYVHSRSLRALGKTAILGGAGVMMFKHCRVSMADLVTGEASRLAKQSLSAEDGDVTCCGSPKQPAADQAPVGVTPDGRRLVDKLTDTKATGGPCGCGKGGGQDEDAASASGGCCRDRGEDEGEACPVVGFHERVKALFAGDLKRGWPVLTMVGAGVAVNRLVEHLIFAAGEARARRGARLPHTQHALVIATLMGVAEYFSDRIGSCECADACAGDGCNGDACADDGPDSGGCGCRENATACSDDAGSAPGSRCCDK